MLIGQRRREAAGGGGMADADWLDCTVYTAAALPELQSSRRTLSSKNKQIHLLFFSLFL
tara:strand:+ start:698 stop:874 length:177 start_codon:yes stop_codon:yes gene_type:complete